MKKVITIIIVLLLVLIPLSGCLRDGMVVGKDIKNEDITEFYYTYSTSTNPPHYQRYHFYTEDGRCFFYHEQREGDHWPLTEEDAVDTGTVELSEDEWAAFLDLVKGGTISKRTESADAGYAGPFLYLYWKGDKDKYQVFEFETWEKEDAFEEFCETLKAGDVLQVTDLPIQHEPEFGGVYIEMTIEDFNALGFEFGDSVNVVFSNGYALNDIPYYNGYYVDAGEPLLIGYPGYDYIKAAINYGADLWDEAELKAGKDTQDDLWVAAVLEEHDTASVVLNEKGKYYDVQMARDIQYWDERERYPSDEVFANFRGIEMGIIKPGILFRSASPCDNQHNRAPYVDKFIEANGVNVILDLADNDAKIEGYIAKDNFDSPYFLSLYEKGNVIPLAMNMNFFSDDFKQKIVQGFTEMSKKDGPYLIHCTEGKDRTGFICMLVEALAGASYDEIIDDYMVTYDNYYKINPEMDPMRYEIIKEKNIIKMIETIVGDDTVDITTAPLAPYAMQYLLDAGMAQEDIDELLRKLSE